VESESKKVQLGRAETLRATAGDMLTDLTGPDAGATRFHRIRHPQLTGMQMNQITMLYTPMRYVSAVEVKHGDEKLFDLEGSMTLPDQRRVRDFGDHDGHERNRVEARLLGRLEQLTFGRRRRRRFVSRALPPSPTRLSPPRPFPAP
jgi:hypothetical protein